MPAGRGTGERSAECGALVELRDAARELLARDADPALSDDDVAAVRARVADAYAAYVARYGPVNRGQLEELAVDPQTGAPALRWRRADLGGFRREPDHALVLALEVYDVQTGVARPAPILTRRGHGRSEHDGGAVTPQEALLLAGDGERVDLARVADLLGVPDAAVAAERLGEAVFRDPEQDGQWVTARAYLSGDLRAKRAVAEAAADLDPAYARNVAALAAATPPDLGPTEIEVSLGAPWVAPSDVEDFVREVLGGRVTVWHLPSAAHWRVVPTGRRPDGGAYGTGRMSAYQLLEAALNGRLPVVRDVRHHAGRRVRVGNVAETVAAQDRTTALQERFRTWLWEDADRAARLCAEYNRRFNSQVVRRADGSGLTFPDLAPGFELWPWQRDIVAQILSSPATLCAHPVGAGKTRAMVSAAMTARRLGLARAPMIAVPAHLVEQTAREARQAYPTGRFLVSGEDGAVSREDLAALCATGDWDAVIVSHGTFSAIPVAAGTEAAWLRHRADEVEAQLRAGRGGRYGRSVLRRRSAELAARIERVRAGARRGTTFDELGTDLLLVDEAHYFKRLPITSRMTGLPLGSSQRAADLLLKARILRERRGSRPSLALFTGTPWSNTIAETFVWQTFLQPEVLAAAGVEQFDAWAATFVEWQTRVEVAPDSSGMRLVPRPSRIRNVPELRAMLARSADVLPPGQLAPDRPDRRDRTVVCEPGVRQAAYVRSLAARVDKIRRETVRAEPGGDNMLVVCGDGRRAALDPVLVGVPERSSKIEVVADTVAGIHHEHAGQTFPGSDARGVLQVVFCDQGTPGPDGLQTYGRLRIALAARGIPAERVRWVHEATTGPERVALFAACRSGAVSVLIGSTDKLGVGTNVQDRLRAVHHADAPWRPSDIEQREGRALRPGNANAVVDVVRYVTRGTFDAYMWQTLERKARFVEQLAGADSGSPVAAARSVDDIGAAVLPYGEVTALAAGNPLLLEHARAAAEVARLRLLRAIDTQAVTAARRELAAAEQDSYRHRQQEWMLRATADLLAATSRSPATDDEQVRKAVRALDERWRGNGCDPAPVRAPCGRLGVEIIPAGGWRAPPRTAVHVRITLAHRRVDVLEISSTVVRRGPDAVQRAVSARLRSWLAALPERTARAADDRIRAEQVAARARARIAAHRFERADELAAAEAELARLTAELEASAAAA